MTDKASIRRDILSQRDSMSEEIRKDKDREIKERLLALSEFKASHKILLYASFRSEVDTFDLLKYCIAHGKVTVLPRVNQQNNELELYEIKDTEELVKGYFGIPEPNVSEANISDRKMNVEHVDLIIVPGVAFDENCHRLGYGKGFYDKLLSEARGKIIGLAYEEQIVELIPLKPHDIRMDMIITDKRIIG